MDFIVAWKAWEEECIKFAESKGRRTVREDLTNRMEDACKEEAEKIGLTTGQFRGLLGPWRSAGLTPDQAFMAIRAGLKAARKI